MFDLETHEVFFSRDVRFEETVFSYSTPMIPGAPSVDSCPTWD